MVSVKEVTPEVFDWTEQDSARQGRVMSRVTIAALLALLFVEAVSAAPFLVLRQVDLNRPGAMENLHASNPSHYGTVLNLLDGLKQRPDEDVPRWIMVNFRASTAAYSAFALTSLPAQKDLSFTLDQVRYRARITLAPGGALVLPRDHVLR